MKQRLNYSRVPYSKFRLFLLTSISVITTLFNFRQVFSGRLLGDPFDARLHVILHEHWWRWFNGLTEFRNTEFFFPYKTALGYSDVFFIQGIVYSCFRFLSYSMTNSWTITTILLLVIGNFGWIFVAKRYFKTLIFQISFVIILSSSLSFVIYFSLNPNIVGYSYLSWFYILYLKINEEQKKSKKIIKVNLFIVFFLIYALSCWYGAFFIFITLLFQFTLKILINKNFLKFIQQIKDLVFSKLNLFFIPIHFYFIWLFYYVYVTVSSEPYRPSEEMLRNSPDLFLLGNGAHVKGGYLSGSAFKLIYEVFKLNKEEEYNIGIGIIAFTFGVFVLMFYLFFKRNYFKNYTFSLAIIISYIFFVKFENFSFHKLFFENLPGFNSIRSPSRYVILIGYYMLFIILYSFEKIYLKFKKYRSQNILIFLVLILLVDQYRTPLQGWDESKLINTDLISKKDEIIRKCDYFYYDKPGGWWYDQIEAMTFSIQVGVPTINGYSGAFPPGYPTEPFNSDSPPKKIFEWISKVDKNLRGCFIAGSTPIKPLNKNLKSIDLVGFTDIEQNASSSWNWATSPNPYLYVVNYSKSNSEIKFKLIPAKCHSKMDIRITEDGKKDLIYEIVDKEGKEFKIKLNFNDAIVKRVEIITTNSFCQFDGDPRQLYFEIKNLTFN